MKATPTVAKFCLALAILLIAFRAHATCDNPERPGAPRPCYRTLEQQIKDNPADPLLVRNLLTQCMLPLKKNDPNNPYILLPLARAYYIAASMLQAWVTIQDASDKSKLCVTWSVQERDEFDKAATELKNNFSRLSQPVILLFTNDERPDGAAVEIDGIEVKQQTPEQINVPLSIGHHSIQWARGGPTCHGVIDVVYNNNEPAQHQMRCDLSGPGIPPPVTDPLPPSHTQRNLGIGLLSAGVATTIVGTILGIEASKKNDELRSTCGGNPNQCPADKIAAAYDLNRAALDYRSAAISTLILGSAATLTGVALLLEPVIFPKQVAAGRPLGQTNLAQQITLIPAVGSAATGIWIRANW